ncbi:hypothetical protein [Gemmobacter serpentinus]|uniref:hypothetical protein n=1 Tax=Gemmobacter serpentinus TaxID=2652247 RepID=UPI00124D76E7|nr:hypothetical protein [Gemmobacter serpentinus]
MAREADFTRSTVLALERRAGGQCSFPDCPKKTSGPSAEGDAAVANTGMACHIYAASDGPSARRVGTKDVKQLKKIENGIWMCYSHGKLIDSDECTYTPETLLDWRRIAERKASLQQAYNSDDAKAKLRTESLAKLSCSINFLEIASAVRKFTIESCLQMLWGEEASLELRNFVIEIARNSLSHGGATNFEIFSSGYSVQLRSDGLNFSLSDLAEHKNGRGSQRALSELRQRHSNLAVSHQRRKNHNEVVITLAHSSGISLMGNPCSVSFTESVRGKEEAIIKIDELNTCDPTFPK